MIKILLVSPLVRKENPDHIVTGGIAAWTEQYLEYCKTHGWNVAHVNTTLTGKRAKELNARKNPFTEISRTVAIVKSLLRELRFGNCDVVHITTNCSKFGMIREQICMMLAKKANLPIVLHCHCNVSDQLGDNRAKLRIFKNIAKKSDSILVLNKASKEYVTNLTGKRAQIIPNMINSERIALDADIKPAIKNIIYTGHVSASKGFFEILETAKKREDLLFLLAGPVGIDLKSHTLPENIVFLGSLNKTELQKKLDEADVFLFPSYTEGFSMSLLEAMARGLPVIATGVGANREMIEQSGGIIVPIGDVAAIVAALDSLASYQVRKEMSDWNIQKVKKAYQIYSVMEQLLFVYKEMSGDVH